VAWLGLGPARTLPTVDPQAYELYLKGNGKLEEMQNGESEAFVEGKALLERALAIEPSAEIYSGLASLHYEAINQGVDPNPENLSLAGFYIDKALALRRDDLAALDTKVMLEFQLGRAEESLALIARQVLDDRLSPVLVNRIGLVLRQNGDFGAAEPFLVYAMKLAPSSFPRQLNYGRHLFESGRHGEAIALMRKLVDEYPEKFWSRMLLASYSLRLGDLPTAERFAAELPATLSARLLRYQIDRAKGDTSPFQPSDRLRRQAAIDFDTSLQLAENYALSGDQVKALEFLRTTLANGWTAWNYFDWDPCLAGLRATPEYRALHAQGLEDQKARRERERTVIAPVVKKLGISILEP
jgi:tetratricopeptide (TPR) repeat protein